MKYKASVSFEAVLVVALVLACSPGSDDRGALCDAAQDFRDAAARLELGRNVELMRGTAFIDLTSVTIPPVEAEPTGAIAGWRYRRAGTRGVALFHPVSVFGVSRSDARATQATGSNTCAPHAA